MGATVIHLDRCQLFRVGLREQLAGDFNVIWDGFSWEEARRRVSLLRPELILLDFASCEKESSYFIRWVRSSGLAAKIVILSDLVPPLFLWSRLGTDVDGYLTKNMPGLSIKQALSLIQQEQRIFPEPLAKAMLERGNRAEDDHGLSLREIEVLSCVRAGFSNKEIANTMAIKEGTVKVHLKSLLRKTRAQNRTQAAVWAIDNAIG
jgi:two-component system nitrate/nitrite response regulator NarL